MLFKVYKTFQIYIRSIKYLKAEQFVFLIFNRLRINFFQKKINIHEEFSPINKYIFLKKNNCISKNKYEFNFINKIIVFDKKIDWNFNSYGKLWNYNLNYLDFLNQKFQSNILFEKVIKDFSNSYSGLKYGKDPYPTSIRILNLIKYSLTKKNQCSRIIHILRKDIHRLFNNLEYHLQGNHLLENGFALWTASYVFNNKDLRVFSRSLIKKELNKQILNDGAHFELSPMYHKIILVRLLESISIAKSNLDLTDKNFLKFLSKKANIMLGWILKITNYNDYFIRINDSIEGIAPKLSDIMTLAQTLDVRPVAIKLKESGLRILDNSKSLKSIESQKSFFCLVDISEIKSSYQPGHSHADTFNFILFFDKKPFIVDPGISTYDISPKRLIERGTVYHNTVLIDNQNNNEIWSSFRMGNRANVNIIKDTSDNIIATHDGYKSKKITHRRNWTRINNQIIIKDNILSKGKHVTEFNLHLHPQIKIINVEKIKKILINNGCVIQFSGALKIIIKDYFYAHEFNKCSKAQKISVLFHKKLITKIYFDENIISV